MGNYRFKLSDMIPNAWFFKLRDIGRRTRKQTTTPSKKTKHSSLPTSTPQHSSSKPKQPKQCNPRKSYYFTRELEPTSIKLYTSSSNAPKFSPDPPSKSSKQRTKKRTTLTTTNTSTRTHSPKKLVNSSVSAGCNCRTTLESVWAKPYSPPPDQYCYPSSSSPQFDSSYESEFPDPEIRTDRVLLPIESSFDEMVSFSTNSCSCCRLNSNDSSSSSSSNNNNNKNNNNKIDIDIDVDKNSLAKRKDDKLDERYEYDSFSELELPRIITKAVMSDDEKKKVTKTRSRIGEFEENHNRKGSMKVTIEKEDTSSIKKQRNGPVKGFCMSSPKVKVRVNSPRIRGGRKSVSSLGSRRSLTDSFAIVKSSLNPQKDFRESMVEMIVENNLRASKDLEDLLACYLSLNSDQYHDLIIKVFKQIWLELSCSQLRNT